MRLACPSNSENPSFFSKLEMSSFKEVRSEEEEEDERSGPECKRWKCLNRVSAGTSCLLEWEGSSFFRV